MLEIQNWSKNCTKEKISVSFKMSKALKKQINDKE